MPYKDLEKRKEYHREYIKKWSAKNLEKRRQITRKSMQKWRDENPEVAALKMREWRKNNKERHLEFIKNYKRNNPNKATAHLIVKDAIRVGIMKRKPCEVCGKENAHAHHEDYSKPLNVIWLCQKHHSERHRARW